MTKPLLSSAKLIRAALARVDDATVAYDDAGYTWLIPYSTQFVNYVGRESHYDRRQGTSTWPLPDTWSCNELATFAARNFVLAGDAPQPGDIYLLWSPRRKRFVRSGIVYQPLRELAFPSGRIAFECLTIDADTNRLGALRGAYTAIIQRVLCPAAGDRLVRWPLLELMAVAEPPSPIELPYERAA